MVVVILARRRQLHSEPLASTLPHFTPPRLVRSLAHLYSGHQYAVCRLHNVLEEVLQLLLLVFAAYT